MAGWAGMAPGTRTAIVVGGVAVAGAVALWIGFAGVDPPPEFSAEPEAADDSGSEAPDAGLAPAPPATVPQDRPAGGEESRAPEPAPEAAPEPAQAASPTEPVPEPTGSAAAPAPTPATPVPAEADAAATAEEPVIEAAAGPLAVGEAGQSATLQTAAAADQTGPSGSADAAPAASLPGPASAGDERAPEIDVLRVTPEGEALVAGRAAPGARVEMLIDGQPLLSADADAAGNFAALFSVAPSEAPRLLTLRSATDGQALDGAQSVIIAAAPTPAPAGDPQSVATAPSDPADPAAEPVAAAPAPAAAGLDDAPQAEEAPVLIIADEEGARIVQPGGDAPVQPQGLVIDTIATTPTGGMTVAGRAEGKGFARLYADNREIATVAIDRGGWQAPLPDNAPARYALRVDQLDADGVVVSRTETEVTRETRDELAGMLVEEVRAGGAGAVVVTVQRGFTLWGIARENYGDGRLYVKVFDANRSQIRNPDLIYPGQVFSVPIPDPAAP
jgi:nucleoid-associated protein YgaU